MNDEELKEAEQLAKDHWEYLSGLLQAHRICYEEKAIAEYHYKTAFIHGFKHALEYYKRAEGIKYSEGGVHEK